MEREPASTLNQQYLSAILPGTRNIYIMPPRGGLIDWGEREGKRVIDEKREGTEKGQEALNNHMRYSSRYPSPRTIRSDRNLRSRHQRNGIHDKATLKTILYGPDDFNEIARRSRLGTIIRTTEDCCGRPFICQTDLVPCHPWGIPYLLIVTIRARLHYGARGNFVSRRDRDETVSFISVVGRVPTGNPLFFFPTTVILQTWAPLSKQLTVLCALPDVETLNPMKRASSTHNFKNFRIVGHIARSWDRFSTSPHEKIRFVDEEYKRRRYARTDCSCDSTSSTGVVCVRSNTKRVAGGVADGRGGCAIRHNGVKEENATARPTLLYPTAVSVSISDVIKHTDTGRRYWWRSLAAPHTLCHMTPPSNLAASSRCSLFADLGNDENSAKFHQRLLAIILRIFVGSSPCLAKRKNRIKAALGVHGILATPHAVGRSWTIRTRLQAAQDRDAVDVGDGEETCRWKDEVNSTGYNRREEPDDVAIQTIRVARNFLHPAIPIYTETRVGGGGGGGGGGGCTSPCALERAPPPSESPTSKRIVARGICLRSDEWDYLPSNRRRLSDRGPRQGRRTLGPYYTGKLRSLVDIGDTSTSRKRFSCTGREQNPLVIGITSSLTLCTSDPVCVNGTRRTEERATFLSLHIEREKETCSLPVRFPDEAMNFIIKRARERVGITFPMSDERNSARQARILDGYPDFAPGILFLFRFNSVRDPLWDIVCAKWRTRFIIVLTRRVSQYKAEATMQRGSLKWSLGDPVSTLPPPHCSSSIDSASRPAAAILSRHKAEMERNSTEITRIYKTKRVTRPTTATLPESITGVEGKANGTEKARNGEMKRGKREKEGVRERKNLGSLVENDVHRQRRR
ncbi:hypothetical protein DBV15_11299 [Temnothorax longispinosus]|uniref:Uncharacterized protein n=1 Tax=Temnothorax longispinosus TaxID=300112 RepID=A0A4S2KA75_9HYME|nr:hypothetical protein DBV15_11299 [Temnothorax longispinosus]